MTREMHNVSMLSDEEVTIEGETYSLEKGDIVALSFKTARNYVNQFGIAEFVGKKYPILDEEYEDTVGPTGDKADGLRDNNPSKGAVKALSDPEQPSNERFEMEDESEEEPEEEEEDEVEESEDEEPEEDEAEEEESESGDVDVTELTVSEVEDEVAEVEDVEVLNGMLKYEEEGDDRKGAKEAINARLEELQDSESDDNSEEDEE